MPKKRKKTSDDIDWAAVREAQKRGKYGRMVPGDQQMCEEAWTIDPDRYAELREGVLDEVFTEVTCGGKRPK